MSLRLGDIAPNFAAVTTQGTINFHEWLGDGWGMLFLSFVIWNLSFEFWVLDFEISPFLVLFSK